MRIVITGGAGFLGSHLTERCLAEGHEVVAVDNLITGSLDNLTHIDSPKFSFRRQNVSEGILVDGAVDFILHFASPASPVDYMELPIQTLKVGALGTHNALGLARAKGAGLLLASTSEIYGDPHVHPQTEDYWGNVNPIGPRSCYDESKRFAEAIVMAYHRMHHIDTKIVRIFNSILADEMVFALSDGQACLETAEQFGKRLESRAFWTPPKVLVPAFDPQTRRLDLCEASAYIRHPAPGKDAFCVRTRYGRHVRVTGDHSVFRRAKNGEPEAIPVRQLQKGDDVAIPARLPMIEKDRPEINLGKALIERCHQQSDLHPREELWNYALSSPALKEQIKIHRQHLTAFLQNERRFDGSANKKNSIGCALRKYEKTGILPLAIVDYLQDHFGFEWPRASRVKLYAGGASRSMPNDIALSDDVLWLLGFYLAEGCTTHSQGTHVVTLSSDEKFLHRARTILQNVFEVNAGFVEAKEHRSPTVYAHSRLLGELITGILGFGGYSKERRIPTWILQLPLSRLKHFLEGYREGDGTHTNLHEKRELAFNTSSERLASDLLYVLLRFGIVGALGKYETTFAKRYGEQRFAFWRVTICEVDNFDILQWDAGVKQTLNARRDGDLVWAKVTSLEPVETTPDVYDFCVPERENFIAGNGVCCHNTFGPRMRLIDGRIVPNFLKQALLGEPLTVYGDGSQTRSFCFATDLVDGIYRLMNSQENLPVNIGNPTEFTILDFAKQVIRITNSSSEIVFRDLPEDDPKQRKPDITRAREILGWQPKIELEEGLQRSIPYFKEKLGV